MNKKCIMGLIATIAAISTQAQTFEDAVRFNINDPQGTARSQAMGSAYGALGADLTSMVTNPSGIAGYRAGEFAFTLGVNYTNSKSNYYGFKQETERTNVSLDQMGGVMGFDKGNQSTGVIRSNLGISYSKIGNFTESSTIEDSYGKNSYLDYFCLDEVKNDPYTGGLAYEAYMTNDTTFADGTSETYNMWEGYTTDKNGYSILDSEMREDANGQGVIDHTKYHKQRGYKSEFSIAYAANISDMWYVGGSMGVQMIDLEQKIQHIEENFALERDNKLFYDTDFRQEGVGINFKIGIVAKPLSFLRIGVAAHTPTFFTIKEKWCNIIESENHYKESPRGEYEYDYRAPGIFVFSAACVLEDWGTVSVDYETSNYAGGKFKVGENDYFNEGAFDYTNDDIKQLLQRVNTLRIGLEARITQTFYARAGYKQSSSPYKANVMINEYKNQTVSLGLGYRFYNFSIDLAYVNHKTTRDYWVLPDAQYPYEKNLPAEINTERQSFVATACFRF